MPKALKLSPATLKRMAALQAGEVPGYQPMSLKAIKGHLKTAGGDLDRLALVVRSVEVVSWAAAEQAFAHDLLKILEGDKAALKNFGDEQPPNVEISKAWALGQLVKNTIWVPASAASKFAQTAQEMDGAKQVKEAQAKKAMAQKGTSKKSD